MRWRTIEATRLTVVKTRGNFGENNIDVDEFSVQAFELLVDARSEVVFREGHLGAVRLGDKASSAHAFVLDRRVLLHF